MSSAKHGDVARERILRERIAARQIVGNEKEKRTLTHGLLPWSFVGDELGQARPAALVRALPFAEFGAIGETGIFERLLLTKPCVKLNYDDSTS